MGPIPCPTQVRLARARPVPRGPNRRCGWPPADLPRRARPPFYDRLNQILDAAGVEAFVEVRCAPFDAPFGRPSLTPGRYFPRLLPRVL